MAKHQGWTPPKKEPASTTAVVLFVLFGVFAMAGCIIAILLSLPHHHLPPPVITVVPVKPHEIAPQNPPQTATPEPVVPQGGQVPTNATNAAPAAPIKDSSQPSAPASATQTPVQEVPPAQTQAVPLPVPPVAVGHPDTATTTPKAKAVKRHRHHWRNDECD